MKECSSAIGLVSEDAGLELEEESESEPKSDSDE